MKKDYKKVFLPLVAAVLGTGAASAEDLSIDINVNSEPDKWGSYWVTLTPSNEELPYVWFFITKEDFDSKGGKEGIVETKIKEYESYAAYYDDGTSWTYFRDLESNTGECSNDMYNKWGTDPEPGVKYYVVAFGLDDDKNLTYPVTTASYPFPEEEEGPAFKFEMTDMTAYDFNLTITPREDVGNYYYYITTPEMVEKWGGIETIDQTLDKDWWEFVAENYNDPSITWVEIAQTALANGTVSGSARQICDVSLAWDTTYVLYAYGMDAEGKRTTDIEWTEFTMPDRNHSDMTFEVWLNSIELNEEASNSIVQTYDVTIDILPSNDEETFGARSVFETTWDNKGEDTSVERWMSENFANQDCLKGLRGYVRINDQVSTRYGRYMVVAGYDELTPTTEPTLYHFTAYDKPTKLEPVGSDELVVLASNGGVRIFGDYGHASVWTADGRLVKAVRGESFIELTPGFYIVKAVNGDKEVTENVIIR